jgi:predicted ATPase
MQCPRCQVPNDAGRKFCSACGQRLTIPCPECAFVNNPGDQFCGGCGKPLSQPALPELQSAANRFDSVLRTLGYAIAPRRGWSAPGAERALTRTRELSQRIEETPVLFGALGGLWTFYFVRANYRISREISRLCVALAEQTKSPELLVEAHLRLGVDCFLCGELTAAREGIERSLRVYDRDRHRSHAFLYGQDPGVVSLAHLSRIRWALGYPAQAITRAHEALALGHELKHPFSLAWALYSRTRLAGPCLRQWREAQAIAEELLALSIEQGFPHWTRWATVARGLALAKQGQSEDGIAQLTLAIRELRTAGSENSIPFALTLLAEAYASAGQTVEGVNASVEAIALAEETGEHNWDAETWRVRGELLLMGSEPDGRKAESCFRRGLEVARRQESKSFELRAATSLSRLWQRQGKLADARRLLGEVYGWFTEGFDTADLKEAKTLLGELNRAPDVSSALNPTLPLAHAQSLPAQSGSRLVP